MLEKEYSSSREAETLAIIAEYLHLTMNASVPQAGVGVWQTFRTTETVRRTLSDSASGEKLPQKGGRLTGGTRNRVRKAGVGAVNVLATFQCMIFNAVSFQCHN